MAKKSLPDLTPQERTILDSLENGLSYEQIAEQMGLQAVDVRNRVRMLLDRADKDRLLARYPVVYMTSQQVEGMSVETDVLKMARESGMSKSMIEAIRRRVNARQGLQTASPSALTDRQLIQVIEQKIALALQYLDNFALAGASAKDLQSVIDGLISNAQLLKGKPTSITSVEDRRKMNELLPLLVEEAKRRGVTINGTAERVDQEKPHG